MLTREELIKIGVNLDNMTYPRGEMNIIVQCFGYEHGIFINEDGEEVVIDNEHPVTEVHPDIYQPRKKTVCGLVLARMIFALLKPKRIKRTGVPISVTLLNG